MQSHNANPENPHNDPQAGHLQPPAFAEPANPASFGAGGVPASAPSSAQQPSFDAPALGTTSPMGGSAGAQEYSPQGVAPATNPFAQAPGYPQHEAPAAYTPQAQAPAAYAPAAYAPAAQAPVAQAPEPATFAAPSMTPVAPHNAVPQQQAYPQQAQPQQAQPQQPMAQPFAQQQPQSAAPHPGPVTGSGPEMAAPPAQMAPVAQAAPMQAAPMQAAPMQFTQPQAAQPQAAQPQAAQAGPGAAGGLPPVVKKTSIELRLPSTFRGASAAQLQSKRLRIGEVLVEMGLITEMQIEEALEKQRESGKRLGQVLQDDGYISATDIAQALARKLNIDFIDLSESAIPEELLMQIPMQVCSRYNVVPVGERNGSLVLAMGDPTNVFALDDIKLVTGRDLEIVVASPEAIDLALSQFIDMDAQVQTAVSQAEDWTEDFIALEDVKDSDADAPAIRLANQIITQAVTLGASDLHFEPGAESMTIRFRKDGVLNHVTNVPSKLALGVTSRLKIMASMDISERRRPQDGRVGILVGGRPIDLRVAVLPTVYGEKTVMRVLDKSNVMLAMDQMGFLPEQIKKLRQCYTQPYGCLLVTGPTGSGKSTTLYGALNEVNDVEKNIITVEDPVEYRLAGINQVQVNVKAGLTFAGALRSILRCDPDIVMIGEMRDHETASIGIEAALTGHLVLSTLHTNTAPGAITRLTEMGIEPFLVSSSILGVLAQRLARRLCKCKEEWVPDRTYLSEMGYPAHIVDGEPPVLYRAKKGGCQRCGGKGYKGRLGLHEVMLMSEEIAALAIAHASAEEIAKVAIDQGMMTLFDDGIHKILRGDTTMEELQRIVQH